MTQAEWLAEVARRIAINEGVRTTMYHDSMGIPTIGIGFNLLRDDADALLRQCGSSLVWCMSGDGLSDPQVLKLFALTFAPIQDAARASLQPSHYDHMVDARRFVVCDLVFNMGADGWMNFTNTRALIDQGCHLNAIDDHMGAHRAFAHAADDLTQSAWYGQVGNRAKRDVAMLRTSEWVNPNGDGS
jgi:GH24 family phage-related lysozyme (muramidase)